MERVVVVGNCQASALEFMLRTNEEFTRRFELVSFPPVHELPESMVPELHRAVAEADVLIPQRIDDDYRDGMGLGTNTLAAIAQTDTVVRWPSVYWAGYFPDLFYLRDATGGLVLDGPSDYHDRTILRAYAAGAAPETVCRLLEDPDRPSDARAWAENATAELSIRGENCDVQVASFIASRFQEELLFFTMNHPANVLLAHMATEITGLLGIPGGVDHHQVADEVLGSTFFPLHANDARALQLEFSGKFGAGHAPFRFGWVTYEALEAVQMFFDYYAAHPDLVELNEPRHQDGST
jgi:hypothetical protein